MLTCTVSAATAFADEPRDDRRPEGPLYETVVVAPRGHARAKNDRAAASSVITADRAPRSAESAAELLGELPGVSVTQQGGIGASATVSLRGSTAGQVGLYVDGIPLNTAVGGGADLALLPLGAMERLEVYRGMSPIAFGASALGGIVSLTTAMPRHNSASAELGGGSFGTMLAAAHGTAVAGRWGALVGIQLLRSEGDFGYPSGNGTAFDATDDRELIRGNNVLRQIDGTARVTLALGSRRRLSASAWLLAREQGLPGDGLFPARYASLTTDRMIAAVRYDGARDLGRRGPVSVQLWTVLVEQRLVDRIGEVSIGPRKTRDRTGRFGATARAAAAPLPWLDLSAVVEGRYERFVPHDALLGDPNAAPSDRTFGAVGIEAIAHWAAAALDVQPSMRLEVARDHVFARYRVAGDERPADVQNHVLPVVRLSLVQRPRAGLALKANVGRYARLPSLRERFGNTGLHLGNEALRPEHGINADIGVSWDYAAPGSGTVRIEGALFGAWVDDLIQLEQGDYTIRAANRDRARILGVEASLVARVLRFGRMTIQATFTDARDTSDIAARRDNQLPLRPRVRLYARPELRGLPFGRGWRLGGYVDISHQAGNFLDPANLVEVGARTMFGAGAYLDIPRTGLRLVLTARNLGDLHTVDYAGYPLPGRTFFSTLKWSSDQLEGDL